MFISHPAFQTPKLVTNQVQKKKEEIHAENVVPEVAAEGTEKKEGLPPLQTCKCAGFLLVTIY